MIKKILRITVAASGLAGLLLLAFSFTQTPQPARALPPRPTEVPTAVPTQTPITGGQIQLIVDNGTGTEWTQVQWQDPNTGLWHDVIGWRGGLDNPTTKTWWVGTEDLGSGPFRWQVYDAPVGQLLVTSPTFDLPQHARQIVILPVTLPVD